MLGGLETTRMFRDNFLEGLATRLQLKDGIFMGKYLPEILML
jgi:hypothetical protein